MTDVPRMLNLVQAEDASGVARGAIKRAIQQGDLPARKLGARWLIDPAELTKWLRQWDAPQGMVKVPGVKGYVRIDQLPADLRARYEEGNL